MGGWVGGGGTDRNRRVGRTRMGGVAANKCVCCMQWWCCVVGDNTGLEFREVASKGAAQPFIIVHVKRDPHVFELVLFLHPKKCLTCAGEKFELLLVLETVPGTFAW